MDTVRISMTLPLDEVAEALAFASRDDVLELILRVDLAYADVGFTELLIRRLVQSLLSDYDTDELRGFLGDLATLTKQEAP